MRQLSVIDAGKCMACLQCVAGCSTAFFKTFDAAKACIRITEPRRGELDIATCDQCGKCAEACEKKAISATAKGVYMISKKLCDGCGKCVPACPKGLIVQTASGEVPTKCIACGICAKQCPMQLLEVVG